MRQCDAGERGCAQKAPACGHDFLLLPRLRCRAACACAPAAMPPPCRYPPQRPSSAIPGEGPYRIAADAHAALAQTPPAAPTNPPATSTPATPAPQHPATSASGHHTLRLPRRPPPHPRRLPPPAHPTATSPPSRTHRQGRCGDKGTAELGCGLRTITGELKTITNFLDKAGIKPSGPAQVIYTSTDDTGFNYEAAVPVTEAPKNLPKNLSMGKTPEGKALRSSIAGHTTTWTTHMKRSRQSPRRQATLEAKDIFD